jgi:aryl-alcohol dehydrogenase-like predicted oxidoreductase
LCTSLARLKSDKVKLLQLHSPRPSHNSRFDEWSNLNACISRLKSEGFIDSFGVSLRSPSDFDYFSDRLAIDSIQVNFNILDQRMLHSGVLDKCQSRGILVKFRTPFVFGFLAGSLPTDPREFKPGDHRRNWSALQLERWSGASYKLREIAKKYELVPAELALRFCVSFGDTTKVISGMHTEQEIENNCQFITRGKLPENILNELISFYERNHQTLFGT